MRLTQRWKPSGRKDRDQRSAGRELGLEEPEKQREGEQRSSEAAAAGHMAHEPAERVQ